jgi:hypothetical protein
MASAGSSPPPFAKAPFVVDDGAALVALLNQVSPAMVEPEILAYPPAPTFIYANDNGVNVTELVFEYAPPPKPPPPITSIVADVQSTGTLQRVPEVIAIVTVGIR